MPELLAVLEDFALVGVGGFFGAIARYVISKAVPARVIPWGTLVVNVVGSFILGFVMFSHLLAGVFTREQRLLIATGFCGALTTFSTFAYETFSLMAEGELLASIVNIILNVVLCLLAVYAGRVTAGWLWRA